jgi:hypothetical protein
MNKSLSLVFAASAALFLSVSAWAADDTARLRIDGGKVMLSQGGEFVAVDGLLTTVVPGDRIMLTEGASATLFGKGGCQLAYTAPGVYEIQTVCQQPGNTVEADDDMVNWTMVSAIGIGAVVVAAATSGGSDDDDTPVSR